MIFDRGCLVSEFGIWLVPMLPSDKADRGSLLEY